MTKQGANVYRTLGASNHTDSARAILDLYCTHPRAVEALLKLERFGNKVWEPCDGLGHISNTLKASGYDVRCSDILTRGRDIERLDFLTNKERWDGDIISNPPYSDALPIILKAIEAISEGHKVAMWLRILFLEGKARQKFYREYPPKRVWISSTRIPCSKNGQHFGASAQGYAWFIWEKGIKETQS